MADFKRKPGESFESFLRKFKRGLKNSKRLEKARSKKHVEPKQTLGKKNEYLRRIGKLPESIVRR